MDNSLAKAQDADARRQNFRKWLVGHDLTPNSAAKQAGISAGTLYNFLNGTSSSLSTAVLQKLAAVTNSAVDAVLTGEAPSAKGVILVTHRVGSGGSLFQIDEADDRVALALPNGFASGEGLSAAIIDGDGMPPIPAGWAVYFETEPGEAADLVGALAVVRFSGGGERPVCRTIRKGSSAGLYTLQAFTGQLTEDVEIIAAHRVVSFSEPKILGVDKAR